MRLNERTDYALRMLMFLAVFPGERVAVRTIAEAYGVSVAHLAKVAQALAHAGFVDTAVGRTGGVTLARPAADIRVGDVVRALEPAELVECFRDAGACPVAGACGLEGALAAANEAFLVVLDGMTIAQAAAARGLVGRLGRKAGRRGGERRAE